MAVEIKVPSVGESIAEGSLVRWLKKNGDTVRADEPLFELETEKATTEVAAPAAGKLAIVVPAGKTVVIGSVVGHIEAASPSEKESPRSHAPQAAKKGAHQGPVTAAKEASTPAAAPSPTTAAAAPDPRQWLSPSARRLAVEAGVDVNRLSGTGRGGRVTKEDVQHFLEGHTEHASEIPSAPAPGPAAGATDAGSKDGPPSARPEDEPAGAYAGSESRRPMSAIRLRIAERLVAAQKTAAILSTFNEADLTAIQSLRSIYKDRFKEKHGVSLGFLGFLV
jgi:2-oxoglutarate dehydrogenase E2 component (dihydrolipoamide succinyltransferase)